MGAATLFRQGQEERYQTSKGKRKLRFKQIFSGVIIDADPSVRHATFLLIRSDYNVSTLSLSLISDTLPSFKA